MTRIPRWCEIQLAGIRVYEHARVRRFLRANLRIMPRARRKKTLSSNQMPPRAAACHLCAGLTTISSKQAAYLAHIQAATRHVDAAGCTLAALAAAARLGSHLGGRGARQGRRRQPRGGSMLGVLWRSATALGALGNCRRRGLGRHDAGIEEAKAVSLALSAIGVSHHWAAAASSSSYDVVPETHKPHRRLVARHESPFSTSLAFCYFLFRHPPRFLLLFLVRH